MAKSAGNSPSLALPDDVFNLLAQADQARGFPPGTMQALMQQEVGGSSGKYLQDPTTYHYPLDASGKRIAGHTGKVSTAFGPFGILESTGAKPGYGVKPLANKSLGEQVRFAGDYLAARSKSAGSLSGGLAGYGEGEKYASQVMGRIGGKPPVVMAKASAPVMAQAAPIVFPTEMPDQMVAQAVPVQAPVQEMAPQPQISPPVMAAGPDPWQMKLDEINKAQAPVQVADLAYGGPAAPVMPQFQRPDFMAALSMMGQNTQPNFSPFASMLGRKARV